MENCAFEQTRYAPTILAVTPHTTLPSDMAAVFSGLAVRVAHQPWKNLQADYRLNGSPDLLLLSLPADAAEAYGNMLDLIERAGSIHCPVILSASLGVIDGLSTEFWSRCHALLAEPDLAGLAAAVAEALSQKRLSLSDVARDADADRLQRLAEEVGRIARTLATLSASAPLREGGVNDARPSFLAEVDQPDSAQMAREIRAILRMRRLRDQFFEASLFADPAWDMLLDLMAARLERVQVAVSSLCIASCVPPTTALRWIKLMTENGMFERVSDPVDGRRVYIRLSDGAAASMIRLLAAMRTAGSQLS